ncbi:MAG: hypothetical protein U5J97_11125 [Trueperaceae bacterium]|nr:hypothetical protein [Trueperaceae bacterium]
MKDEHLTTALQKALNRYGSSELPEDAHVEGVTRPPRRPSLSESLRRKPGWVTVSEIESSQSPNSYPRLTRRAIKARCKELAHAGGTPVVEVRTVGLRSWVRVAAPSPSAPQGVGGSGETVDTGPVTGSVPAPVIDLVTDLVTDVGQPSLLHADVGDVGHTVASAAMAIGVDIDLDVDLDIVDHA